MTSFTLFRFGDGIEYGKVRKDANGKVVERNLTRHETTREGMYAWLESQTRSDVVIKDTKSQVGDYVKSRESTVLSYFKVRQFAGKFCK